MISDDQLSFIRRQLAFYQLNQPDLNDDLVDHFGCVVEELMSGGMPFEKAFEAAFRRISPNGPKEIEKELIYLLTIKRKTMFRKMAYLFGYLSLVLITCGTFFVPFFQQKSSPQSSAMGDLIALSGVSVDKDFQLLALSDLAYSAENHTAGDTFWVLGVALFLLTVVPFWFYKSYQKSVLKLQNE
jgi:hypothetical protein